MKLSAHHSTLRERNFIMEYLNMSESYVLHSDTRWLNVLSLQMFLQSELGEFSIFLVLEVIGHSSVHVLQNLR